MAFVEYTAQLKHDGYIAFDTDCVISALAEKGDDGNYVLDIREILIRVERPSDKDVTWMGLLGHSKAFYRELGLDILAEAKADNDLLELVMEKQGISTTPIPEPYTTVNHAQTGVMRGRAA